MVTGERNTGESICTGSIYFNKEALFYQLKTFQFEFDMFYCIFHHVFSSNYDNSLL